MANRTPVLLTTIYGLKNPVDDRILYIGKADHPRERYLSHLKDKAVNKRTNWIKSLLRQGITPELEIIDEVPICNWKFWEQHYIKLFRTLGAPLKNQTDGGDGGAMSKDVIEKTKLKLRGRKDSDETRAKKSLAFRGLKRSQKWHEAVKKYNSENPEKVAIRLKKMWNTRRENGNIGMSEKAMVQAMRTRGCKPILQYDKAGNFIKEWEMGYFAVKELKINSSSLNYALKNERIKCGGFYWRNKSQVHNYEASIYEKIDVPSKRKRAVKAINQYDLNGNFIQMWNSAREISINTGSAQNVIINCCKMKAVQSKGFTYRYADSFAAGEKIKLRTNEILRPVIQSTWNGEFISEFNSIMNASRNTNISHCVIHEHCKGKYFNKPIHYNSLPFTFKYKEVLCQ